MIQRPRRRVLQTALPVTYNARVPQDNIEDGFAIPSQVPPEPIEQYAPPNNLQPDIRWQEQAKQSSRGIPNFDPDYNLRERAIVNPGGIRLANFTTKVQGLRPSIGGHKIVILTQVLPVRPDRKRFIICNPDTNSSNNSGQVMFYCYKNASNGLLPVYSGQIIDESGSMISFDDIWIGGLTAGDTMIVYEGRLQGDYIR